MTSGGFRKLSTRHSLTGLRNPFKFLFFWSDTCLHAVHVCVYLLCVDVTEEGGSDVCSLLLEEAIMLASIKEVNPSNCIRNMQCCNQRLSSFYCSAFHVSHTGADLVAPTHVTYWCGSGSSHTSHTGTVW